jgi:hypothetical protein
MIVGGWIVKGVMRVIADTELRKTEMRTATQAQAASLSNSDIEKLRAEISQLRETTTQHALSLQHSMERLDHRVEFIERTALQPRNGVDTTQQIIGRS